MKLRTSWIGLGFLTFLGCVTMASAAPRGVNLANLTDWDLVVDANATPAERQAAEELCQHVARATGVTLPIVSATDRPDRHLFVGPGEALRQSGVGFSVDGFGPEDLRIIIRDDLIAIAGGRPRGTLYGVYTFLEDYLGIRFLTADHTHIPPIDSWHVIGPVDRFYHPPLEMRWSYYGEVNRNAEWAAHLRVNTVGDDPRFGGRSPQRLISHSFVGQIPSSKYGEEHPEYYCLRDGKRLAQVDNDAFGNEPCLTNPDVLKIVTEAVVAEIKAHPEAGNISVSQNDNDKYCQCPECAAIDQREGTPMGSLLTFVNAIADQIGPQYPDVKIGTLSYWYSRRPPKTIQPRPNVQIQLCSIECCLLHPINDPNCPKNVEFCRDMDEWGKICDQISIWNYNTNFSNYLLPLPNLRVIGPNIRYFVSNHAQGAFMQAAGNANGAEISELRTYLISQLLWDPSRNEQRVIDEFLDLHYGRAAGPIRSYLERIHDRAAASGRHQNCFGRLADYGLDDTDAQAGLELFQQALELAPDEETRDRVERASLCVYRAALEPIWYLGDGPVDPDLAERLRPIAARFFTLCDKFQVDRPQEWGADIAATRQRIDKVLQMKEPAAP